MRIYIAYDEDGLPVAESYRKQDLELKLIDEFGHCNFEIRRVFEKYLK